MSFLLAFEWERQISKLIWISEVTPLIVFFPSSFYSVSFYNSIVFKFPFCQPSARPLFFCHFPSQFFSLHSIILPFCLSNLFQRRVTTCTRMHRQKAAAGGKKVSSRNVTVHTARLTCKKAIVVTLRQDNGNKNNDNTTLPLLPPRLPQLLQIIIILLQRCTLALVFIHT